MNNPIVHTETGVTLAGGAPFSAAILDQALRIAPHLVAADGGADRLLRLGQMPEAVIGDFDSISVRARGMIPAARQHRIAEQDTTDFDKALRSIMAPFVLGLGFSGARADHGLAALNALVRHRAQACILLSGRDAIFHAPPQIELVLPVGARLSLFPLARVAGESAGLRWPIRGVAFDPAGAIGTSNMVAAPHVMLRFDRPGMLVILPRAHLRAVLAALVPGHAVR